MSKLDARATDAQKEGARIQEVYERRQREIPEDRYAPWNAAELFMRHSRVRVACEKLRSAGCFPGRGTPCLEVGYGHLGWLGELIGWGVRASDLHGIELDPTRAAVAADALPGADLRVGDASELPWPDGAFALAIASTVFTSILDFGVRRAIADEMVRVLAPRGALLWYDFAFDNPWNPHVAAISRRGVESLFPSLAGSFRRATLAPPLTRIVAPRSHLLASALESVPLLRTHLVGVLVKRDAGRSQVDCLERPLAGPRESTNRGASRADRVDGPEGVD